MNKSEFLEATRTLAGKCGALTGMVGAYFNTLHDPTISDNTKAQALLALEQLITHHIENINEDAQSGDIYD